MGGEPAPAYRNCALGQMANVTHPVTRISFGHDDPPGNSMSTLGVTRTPASDLESAAQASHLDLELIVDLVLDDIVRDKKVIRDHCKRSD
jgi:hypothetical protein